MRLLCPNCREKLEIDDRALADGFASATTHLQSPTCPNGHVFNDEDGVLQLLTDDFAAELSRFTAVFSQMRTVTQKRLPDPSVYPQLPFIEPAIAGWEWRTRQYDLEIIQLTIEHLQLTMGGRKLRALDVGAWNGWLSYRLAMIGHQVTAVDYFLDAYDGLAAKKFYPTNWQAIQMDLTDLSVLDTTFDLIILNRCLQFAPNPLTMVAQAQARLAPGGCLIITGLQLFADARQKAQQVSDYRQKNREEFGFELFLKPTRGYLDWADKAQLAENGVSLRPYPQLWRANLKARFKKSAPAHYFGVYQAQPSQP